MAFTPLVCGLVLGLAAVVLVRGAVCSSAAAELDAAAAATPEAALAAAVQLDGGRFAGACNQTRAPDDIGAMCSTLVGERGSLRAYLLGRTFSEFDTWVFLKDDGSRWTVLVRVPLDAEDLTMTIPWPY